MTRIIVADDHQIVRKGIYYTLMGDNDLVLEDEASSFSELSKLLQENHYDLLLMDLQLGDKNGIHGVREISDTYPNIKF